MKDTLVHLSIYVLMLFALGACLSCQERQDNSNEVIEQTEEREIPRTQENRSISCRVGAVRRLAKVDREVLPFNGGFLSALAWADRLGEHTLVLSEKGKYDGGNGRKELFGYHYMQRDTTQDLLWQINDFVDGYGCDLDIELIHFFPLVSDIDSNGIAETAIFYSLNNRCDATPFSAKLIVHEMKISSLSEASEHNFWGHLKKYGINIAQQKDYLPESIKI
ncbi:MAG: hypothetical protein AAGI23_22115 [Bacteroidota bacterium]